MPTVELIYDADCPNVPQARENILRAFIQAGLAPRWKEWERADRDAPDYVRAWGSPTVLVNGEDVTGLDATDAACCRIYTNGQGSKQGVPPVTLIAATLANSAGAGRIKRGAIPMLPAIGTALMPKLVCPACWPAYTGILSALGLGFVNYSPYLLPLTATFLLVVLVSLAWKAKVRRGYTPLTLGVLAATMILVGKFQLDSDAMTYAGIALLIGASLWNAWPRRISSTPCPDCVSGREPNPDVRLRGGTS